MPFEINKPSPEPVSDLVTNIVNNFYCILGSIPVPLSLILIVVLALIGLEIMGYNSVLKNCFEINHAIDRLSSLGLFPHNDRVKSWDTLKMVDIIKQSDTSAFVLDVGCNG